MFRYIIIVMIYFIIGDTLIMIYLFYYLYKKLNKINSKPESKKRDF